MNFKYKNVEMFEDSNNETSEKNSYLIVSKQSKVKKEKLKDTIKIIDEDGKEMDCTEEKFIEIFDKHGLSGFIL